MLHKLAVVVEGKDLGSILLIPVLTLMFTFARLWREL